MVHGILFKKTKEVISFYISFHTFSVVTVKNEQLLKRNAQ